VLTEEEQLAGKATSMRKRSMQGAHERKPNHDRVRVLVEIVTVISL
jgi:hypothetical protein